MRYGKIIIGFLTAFLMALLFSVLILCTDGSQEESRKPEVSLTFAVQSGESRELIHCWENPEGEFFVFLPGYADMEDVSVSSAAGEIRIGEDLLTKCLSCAAYELNRTYPFACKQGEKTLESTITFVYSGSVPSLYIDVQSGSMDYIHLEKGNEETGMMRLYGADGKILYSGNLSSVKGRGNTSWYADKKPYSLTLSEDADLLNMGAAKRWILLAEGGNPLNIRNKIVCDFAKAVDMPFSPDCEWVNLYLNGEYTGLYLLTERNEVHPQRVDIDESGSFLISMEDEKDMEEKELPYIKLDSAQVIRVRFSSIREQELAQMWSSLKNALVSENGTDSKTGMQWTELIDLDSWVKKYLIEEIFANVDGGAVSQYFYLDGTAVQPKIFAGPVWDYDYSMGGEEFWLGSYPAYLTMAREYTDDGLYLPWFYELYRKETFYTRLQELYEEAFLPSVTKLIETGLDQYFDLISQSAVCDGIRWDHAKDDIQADYDLIKSFLAERIRFLNELWIQEERYHIVRVTPENSISGYLAIKDGEKLPELPEPQSSGSLGWYQAHTDEPFDVSQSIYEDSHIFVKRQETKIPVIHYLPFMGMVLILTGLLWVDRRGIKRWEVEK